MEGIALFSRGKLVNEHSFYDVKASSHGYKYITGWLDVSYIDLWEKEVISTNRKSLNWEDEDAFDLKEYLNQIIHFIYNEQRRIKRENKKTEIQNKTGINIEQWIIELPKHEGKLAGKIVNTIIDSEGIETEKAGELVKFVKDSFQYEAFLEFANDIESLGIEDQSKIIQLFRDWEMIEARELFKIAKVRLETIKKFETHIESNAREVPELHNFLKQFSWILDPRIMNFEDEVTYSKLLKDNFVDSDELEENRRLDFLCVDFSESFFIIELKRPQAVISLKNLEQAIHYVSFIREQLGNEYGKNIYCYILGKRLVRKDEVKILAESLQLSRTVYFKPYIELLKNAKKYHQEFIDRYNQLNSSKSCVLNFLYF